MEKELKRNKVHKSISAFAVLGVLAAAVLIAGGRHYLWAQVGIPAALPAVSAPPSGDPRLEPIPPNPIRLANFDVVAANAAGVQHVITMRFPPRVNGQTASDGDGHADMYVLYNAATGQRINQPPIVEAVPNGATGPGATVSDLKARLFSSIWELQAVTVDPTYDPTNPLTRIDSALKVTGPGASPLVKTIYQTNIFLNCPIVPAGTVLDPVPGGPGPNDPHVVPAFFEGQIVNVVFYDIEDGPANPQIMFKFVDPSGNTLPSADAPKLVLSHMPGDPFYTSIWEVWAVHVPDASVLSTLNSKAEINNSGYPITSSGIRLNCPAVAVDGVSMPFEDPFALLSQVTAAARGFGTNFSPVDVAATSLSVGRTHLITELNLPILTAAAPVASVSAFPPIDPTGKGNVIPLIFSNPLQVVSSGPTTTGDILRINQPELDAAFALPPPRLPAAFETNFSTLIAAGLLSPNWAPGVRPYQQRLALLGRAFFELVFKPEQGAHSRDVSRCFACHSTSASGGAARQLYTLKAFNPLRPEFGPIVALNAGSMWGGGGAELLRNQLVAAGAAPCITAGVNNPPGCTTFAHGSRGNIANLRTVTAGAFFGHVGIESIERILGLQTAAKAKGCDTDGNGVVSVAEAANCDLDGDGIVNEMTVGEVTAVTTFFMDLPVPDKISPNVNNFKSFLSALGITTSSVDSGAALFRSSIDKGGVACASCHVQFRPFPQPTTTFNLTNPETAASLPIQVAYHTASQQEVNTGLASVVGQPGLRLWGDFKLHKMGSQMNCSGTDTTKTAEIWDAGSVFPYMRCGTFGSNLNASILAHGGVSLSGVSITKAKQVDSTDSTGKKFSSQIITLTNSSGADIVATAATPIRVVLTAISTPGALASNYTATAPDGGRRQGALWTIGSSIPNGGSIPLTLIFENPSGGNPKNFLPLVYDLAIQDNSGFSEAVASITAYKNLALTSPSRTNDIINFLRVQLIGSKVGEGSGGAVK